MKIIKRGGKEYRELTDDELLERMNQSLSGKHYSNEEFWKLVYEARNSNVEQKTFNETKKDDNTTEN